MTDRVRRPPSWLTSLALLSAVVLVFGTFAAAQSESATLSGTIMDSTGAVIPDAQVQVTNSDTNVTVNGATNKSGIYVIPSLKPGRYRLAVTKQGFKQVSVTDVVLNVQDVVSRNFTLEVGATSETVTVSDESAHLNTTDAAVTTVVDRRFVENMPLNGRSLQALFNLTPGVTTAVSSFGNQGQFSINGQRTDANYFMVDGASANVGIAAGNPPGQSFGGTLPAFSASGGTNSLVSIDAVQEFAIQTSTYAPEFGRTPGGQISIVTRSGTNQFHGNAFEYLRNDVFDANDWFASHNSLPKPKERQSDFGATLGGPVLRDHTFFFVSYEGLRLRQPSVGISDVPTIALRNSAPAAIQSYLKAFPLPTGADEGNGLAPADYSVSNPTQLDSVGVRVDQHFSDGVTIFGRYNHAPSSASIRGGGGGASLNTVTVNNFSTQTATLGMTYVPTSRIVNEARFNWSGVSSASGLEMDAFGGAGHLDPNSIFPSSVNPLSSLFNFAILSGKNATLGIGPNVNNRQSQVNLVDGVSWQEGTHVLKLGIDYRRLIPVFGPRVYSQLAAFNGTSSILTSRADLVQIGSDAGAIHGTTSNYSLYAQDAWKVLAKLTVTYGVRWDYDPTPSINSASGIGPAVLQNINNLATLSFAPSGTPLYHATADNFAPRLGIAYQFRSRPGSDGVLRIGAGMFYDLNDGVVGSAAGLYPFFSTASSVTQAFPLTPSKAAPLTVGNTPPFPPIQGFPSTLKQPYTYHWNAAYEQVLGSSQSLTVGYVGSAGHSLVREVRFFSPPLNPSMFQQVRLATNEAYSNYNALQVSFRHRASKRLNILAAYTYAHSLDDASDDQGANPGGQFLKPNSDYSSSDFDIRHAASAGVDYELTMSHESRWTNALLKGWAFNSLITTRSAPPVNVTVQRTLPFGQFAFRPDVVPGARLYTDSAFLPGGRKLNTNAFTIVSAPVQGDLGRNGLRGFGLFQQDFSIRRRFVIAEKVGLQARLDIFNILNHPNFSSPPGSLGSESASGKFTPVSTFGISQSLLNQGLTTGTSVGGVGFSPLYQLGGARSMQVAIKVDF